MSAASPQVVNCQRSTVDRYLFRVERRVFWKILFGDIVFGNLPEPHGCFIRIRSFEPADRLGLEVLTFLRQFGDALRPCYLLV